MEIRLPQTLTHRLPFWVFLCSAAAELLSYWGWHVPGVRVSVLALLAAGAVALAYLDLRWLYGVVLVEMAIGSHGRLFFADIGGFSVSLRMVWFAALAGGWLWRLARDRGRLARFRRAPIAAPLLLLLAALAFASLRGWSAGAPFADIFNDANGYAFMLLIPIGLDLFAEPKIFDRLLGALSGAVAWLCAKSVLLLYLFSHAFDPAWLRDVFLWQRRFGLSEITHLSGGAERVFAASEVLLIPALFLGALLAWETRRRATLLWTALVAAAFLLSLSRSFWLGTFAASVLMLPVFLRFKIVPPAQAVRLAGTAFGALALGAALLVAAAVFPLPARTQNAAAWSVYGGRVAEASDAAVSSRWNMLPPLREAIGQAPILGSGFGAKITYQSDDPRMHDLHPGGVVTTGAIEWQYLEIWLKMGLLSVLAVLWLWWRLGVSFWKTLKTARGTERLAAAGLSCAFLAFVVANVFTPYLNHPLGWAFLALVIVGLHAASGHDEAVTRESPRQNPSSHS